MWKAQIARYETPNNKRSLWQICNSVGPYILLWYLAAISRPYALWLTAVFALIATCFFIRVFIIFHDCGHYAFFRNRRANDWTGVLTGILTLFPFYKWRHDHALHHATSGNLDKRGTGDLWILTVKEYRMLSPIKKRLYRLYRNPWIMFGLGPIYLLVQSRFNRKNAQQSERRNTYLTNVTLLVVLYYLTSIFGWQTVVIVQGIIVYCASVVGVWLFYVQHQFEGTYFKEDENWDYFTAALQGSSYYKLPRVLQWITGNIGFHHVHHLGPRVPNYQLENLHNHNQRLQSVPKIGLRESFRFLRFRLWDEETEQFVGIDDVK